MMTYTEEDAMYWVEFTPIYMTREKKKTIKENCIKVYLPIIVITLLLLIALFFYYY